MNDIVTKSTLILVVLCACTERSEPAPYTCSGGDAEEALSCDYSGPDGQLLSRVLDQNGDGIADGEDWWTYDENGYRAQYDADVTGDGISDWTEWFTYDEAGRLLSWYYDQEGDGVADGGVWFTYDEAGNRLTWEADHNADGTSEEFCYWDPPCGQPYDECPEPVCEEVE